MNKTTTQILEAAKVEVVDFQTILVEGKRVEGPLAYMVTKAIEKFEDADDSLVRAIMGLQRDLANAMDNLENGFRVNEIGVVQRQGSEVDRFCALRQAAVDNILALAFALRKNNEEN